MNAKLSLQQRIRQHKNTVLIVALVAILGIPFLLYVVAQAQLQVAVIVLLVLLTLAMLLLVLIG